MFRKEYRGDTAHWVEYPPRWVEARRFRVRQGVRYSPIGEATRKRPVFLEPLSWGAPLCRVHRVGAAKLTVFAIFVVSSDTAQAQLLGLLATEQASREAVCRIEKKLAAEGRGGYGYFLEVKTGEVSYEW